MKRVKGALDVKRGKTFATLSNEISIAAKISRGDPNMYSNAEPRLTLQWFFN